MIAYGDNIKIFCGNSNPEFAKTICEQLGLEIGMEFAESDALKNVDLNRVLDLVKLGAVGKLLEVETAEGDFVEIVVE